MRTLQAPDWGYAGFGLTVVGLGIGMAVANLGAEYFVGPALMLLGLLLILYSLRPSFRSLLRREEDSGSRPSLSMEVTKARFWWRRKLWERDLADEVLALELLVTIENPLSHEIKVRPMKLALLRHGHEVPATFFPRIGIDPMGRVADYSYFHEGQHAVSPHSEKACFFWFDAISPQGWKAFFGPGLELRLMVSVPGPWPSGALSAPLPPLSLHPHHPEPPARSTLWS